MKTGRMLRGTYLALAVCAFLALGLAGCNIGSTGDTGPAGPAGPPGQTTVVGSNAKSLTLKITGVTIGHQTTVDFTAVDQNGTPFAGIPQGDIELTIAELIPGTDGDADHWQNYVNQERQAVASNAPMTEAPQPQAISGSDGTLANHQDGSYTFTFGGQGSSLDVTDITTPVTVKYDPGLTQRVALTLRTPHGSDPTSPLNFTNNAIYTWQPSTGATTGIPEKKMVSTATCDSCHGELDLHGGPRHDVAMCVTCHNAGNTDPNTGYTLAFNSMIHRIHAGSVLAAAPYNFDFLVYGYMNNVTNFNDVVFPQNIENCSRCHDPGMADVPNAPWTSTAQYHTEYPDWDRYETRPTMASCGSCHVNVDFAQGKAGGHPGGVETDNSECTVCHSSGSVAGSVAESHLKSIPEQEQLDAKKFAWKILSIQDHATGSSTITAGDQVDVTFEVLDPQNNNQPYDFSNTYIQNGSINLDVGWSTTNYTSSGYTTLAYTNTGANPSSDTGSATSQPIHFGTSCTSGTTCTVTSPNAVPSGTKGSGVVAIEGFTAYDYNGNGSIDHDERIPVTSVAQGFSIADGSTTYDPPSTLTPETMVDIKKCQVCHGRADGLAMHGGNRNDNLQVCVVCHNPNETDLSQRPPDPDNTVNGVNSAATGDGLEQRPIDFKYMIHAIHGAAKRTEPFVVYGYRGSVNDFSDVQFPNPKLSCNICHTGSSYEPPLPAGVLPTTVDSGATVNSSGSGDYYTPSNTAAFDPSDDHVTTPTAAACSACHTSATARAHMQTNGALITTEADVGNGSATSRTQAQSTTEACAVCHGSGTIADVAKVHDVH